MTILLTRFESALFLIKSNYLEMPGLSLTPLEAAFLSGAEPECCHAILEALADSRFLYRCADGTYVRRAGRVREDFFGMWES
jgi:hypothetical protein